MKSRIVKKNVYFEVKYNDATIKGIIAELEIIYPSSATVFEVTRNSDFIEEPNLAPTMANARRIMIMNKENIVKDLYEFLVSNGFFTADELKLYMYSFSYAATNNDTIFIEFASFIVQEVKEKYQWEDL